LLFVPRVGKPGEITAVVSPKSTNAKFQDLPPPTGNPPYHLDYSKAFPMIADGNRDGDGIVFHMVGDTGDTKNPSPAELVALAMEADIDKSKPGRKAMFLYHVGDLVYKFGEASEYYSQFYDHYAHDPAPIFAIPGNKDGDVRPDSNVRSLQAFVNNFCARERGIVTPDALEIPRDAMFQPNVYWTLDAPFVTIIGLYSNVPDGGVIKEDQLGWFNHELEIASQNKALIVAVHHAPFSGDEEHSGSDVMLKLLDKAFKSTDRLPDMVVSGHVHNYQRFTRKLGKHYIPFLVIGYTR